MTKMYQTTLTIILTQIINMIAKITIETSEGSVTRHYDETMLLNGEIDTQAEVESMTQNIIKGAEVINYL